MNEIKATLYKTDGTSEAVSLKPRNRLKTLQKLVGGYIEIIYLFPYSSQLGGLVDGEKDLVINEEGALLNLPVNPWSSKIGYNTIWKNQLFRGDVVLIEGRLP